MHKILLAQFIWILNNLNAWGQRKLLTYVAKAAICVLFYISLVLKSRRQNICPKFIHLLRGHVDSRNDLMGFGVFFFSFSAFLKSACVWTFQVIYSKYTDLVPKEVMNADDPDLQRPDEEAIKEVTGNCYAELF